jgi:hypothetical protein
MYRLAYGFFYFEIYISELRMLQEEAEKREQELQEKLRREEEERKERKKGAWHNRQILIFNSCSTRFLEIRMQEVEILKICLRHFIPISWLMQWHRF